MAGTIMIGTIKVGTIMIDEVLGDIIARDNGCEKQLKNLHFSSIADCSTQNNLLIHYPIGRFTELSGYVFTLSSDPCTLPSLPQMF